MADAPDWTNVASNIGTIIAQGTLASFTAIQQDVSFYQSVIIFVEGQSNGQSLWVASLWESDLAQHIILSRSDVTGVAVPGLQTRFAYETPLYSPILFFENLSPQTVNYMIVGSSRVVSVLKMLSADSPARVFGFNGAFVSGTPQDLTPVDGSFAWLVSNGKFFISGIANPNVQLVAKFIRDDGTVQLINIGTTVVGVTFSIEQALPQGIIQLQIIPTATSGAGTSSFQIVRSQL